MKCIDVENKLIFYLEGDLKTQDNIFIEKHLDHCGKCRKLFDALQATWSVMDDEKAMTPDPFVYNRIMARLESSGMKKKKAGPIGIPRLVRVAAIVLLLVLAGFTGTLLGSKYVQNNLLPEDLDPYEYYAQEFYLDSYADESIEYYILNQNEYEDENGK
ncbi:MAG: zf-HC2 domain-containing protein [Bacteroidales bacterium]|nr:zf-HC2 domain-containing protein [Bacteroidales bacterium]MCF8343419.1 zf-HC2 domain-containing protein [Bacteroidales bacterium]MCF8349859.1 zf-HC2 domain-containing protein [Bacteroidales bacterium]MCF8375545.1 zf-HC2 domain-containing protein [Bacteroidales bacterium]MCF8399944.1 zf-HC2 domain-containing protein [Bacteroidales bacterium]